MVAAPREEDCVGADLKRQIRIKSRIKIKISLHKPDCLVADLERQAPPTLGHLPAR